MAEHTPTPWTYRPNKHDDWGWIRDAEGGLAATARNGRVYSEQFDEFRAAGKDPFEPNAAFIVKAVNNHEALVKALKDLCDEIACEEQHGDGADDPGCQTCRAHKRARKLLSAVGGA